MWARVTTSMVEPDSLDEEKRIFEEDVIPAAKQMKGFQGALWLSDPGSGKGVTITMWASREDMLTSEESGFWQAQVQKFEPIMTGPPQKEHFEVMSEVALAHTM